MGYSRFETAELDGSGAVTVRGPIQFAEDEEQTTEVKSVNFVLVQGDEVVHGTGEVRGEGSWAGEAGQADELVAGRPAQGFGVAVLVRRAQQATSETPATPPVVQMLTWSEAVTITS